MRVATRTLPEWDAHHRLRCARPLCWINLDPVVAAAVTAHPPFAVTTIRRDR